MRKTTALIVLAVFLFRLFNACLLRTYFDPDEYWQCIEIAHKYVFGYGYETWDWMTRIRSWVFVLPFIGVFKLSKLFGLDSNDKAIVHEIIYGPRMLQALIATLFDISTWKFSRRIYGKSVNTNWTLVFSLISMFNFVYLTRTISNSMEAALSAFALCLWPINGTMISMKKFAASISIIGLSCLIKPSAALHWLFPAIYLIISASMKDKMKLITIATIIGVITIVIGAAIDTYFYQADQLVFTWWNFARENLSNKASLIFGSNPWHFYLSQGLPLMMFTLLPLVMVGVIFSGTGWPFGFIAGSVWFNSLLSHKEFRFLFPCMPVILSLACYGRHITMQTNRHPKSKKIVLAVLLIVSNLGAGFYLARWHQSGPLPAIDWLREQIDSNSQIDNSAFFMMPCHSTPFYGYLHRNIPMDFLTCTPPVINRRLANKPGFIDEADKFYNNPISYLDGHPEHLKAKYIFCFEHLIKNWPQIDNLLEANHFQLVNSFFHSHLCTDSRRSGRILAFKRIN